MKKKSKKRPAKKSVIKVKDKLTPEQRKRQIEASKGNHWWALRSDHGRDKIFKEPVILLEEALKYFKWCEENPENRAELVKYEGGARQVKVDLKRPYTMQGLCRFLDCNTAYFRQFKAALRAKGHENWTPQDKDFSTVIHKIEEIVEEQQIAGALCGHFNANIISRLLGLVDRKDVTTSNEPLQTPVIKVYNTAPPLAGSEDEIKD